MKTLLWFVISGPIFISLVLLALANDHSVKIFIGPAAPDSQAIIFEVPLFIAIFLALGLGLLLGGFACWLGQAKWRRRARTLYRETSQLRAESMKKAARLEEASSGNTFTQGKTR